MAEKEMMSGKIKDTLLEGHDADGITEFDNDMPMWWVVGFIFTIVFAFGYLVNYHVAEGPSSKQEYEKEVAAYKKLKEPADSQPVVLAALTDTASIEAGKAIFTGPTNSCFTCHRADLGGLVGPNLTDEYWIHGGDFQSIVKSIKTGYPEKGMQPFGTNAKLSDKQVVQVASFILSMKGTNPQNPKPIDPTREIKYVPEEEKAKTEKPPAAKDAKDVKDAKAAKPAEKKPEATEKPKVAKN